jgi:hypothetical protein
MARESGARIYGDDPADAAAAQHVMMSLLDSGAEELAGPAPIGTCYKFPTGGIFDAAGQGLPTGAR